MQKRESKAVDRSRPDGRKALLVYLRPDVIKQLKIAALDEDRPAYALAEEALSAWLAARRRGVKGKVEHRRGNLPLTKNRLGG